MMKLGKHTNDHMVSFYLRTPSGFNVEYGWAPAKWTMVLGRCRCIPPAVFGGTREGCSIG